MKALVRRRPWARRVGGRRAGFSRFGKLTEGEGVQTLGADDQMGDEAMTAGEIHEGLVGGVSEIAGNSNRTSTFPHGLSEVH